MRILHIVSAYCTVHFNLNEDNLCTISVRGQEPRLVTMEYATERFNSIPWVNGCGGILHSYIFNTETRETNYL